MKNLDQLQPITETAKGVTDHIAGIAMLAAWVQWLPSIAAIMSIIWYAIRIYAWISDKRKARQAANQPGATAPQAASAASKVFDE